MSFDTVVPFWSYQGSQEIGMWKNQSKSKQGTNQPRERPLSQHAPCDLTLWVEVAPRVIWTFICLHKTARLFRSWYFVDVADLTQAPLGAEPFRRRRVSEQHDLDELATELVQHILEPDAPRAALDHRVELRFGR